MRKILALLATLVWFCGGLDFWIWFLGNPWKYHVTVYLTPVVTLLIVIWLFGNIIVPFAVLGDEF